MSDYDEFAQLGGNAAELGLPDSTIPPVRRVQTAVAEGQISAVEWGGNPKPSLVFLHGGGQNAHTWDSVLLVLNRQVLAIDLPGHGDSSWREDRDYSPQRNAQAVAAVLRERSTSPVIVVGMSLGGLTAISLAAQSPELLAATVLVDVTPASPSRSAQLSAQQRGAVALTSGAPVFESFEAMVAAAVAASPRRPEAALRRGVRHNSRELPDGRWAWRYDQLTGSGRSIDFSVGWDELSRVRAPMLLVRGGDSGFVADEDVAEMTRRRPGLQVETVADAAHSVQSDQPLALVRIIAGFVDAQSAVIRP